MVSHSGFDTREPWTGDVVFACHSLDIETHAAPGFSDLTECVIDIVKQYGLWQGQVTVYSTHTTAAIPSMRTSHYS
jgi:thiamine phosphate synthase YjbQ (UPF0047 family)